MTQAVLPLFEAAKANGEANKIDPDDLPVHDWYRFVLSFPPHLVREYLRRFDLSKSSVILDPFCGTGTSIVECKKMGFPSVGIEALPMPAFASRVKTTWSVDPYSLMRHASALAGRTLDELRDRGISDDPAFSPGRTTGDLRTLPPEAFRLLLKGSISALPLHKTLVLLDHIQREKENPFRQHELLALAKALVTSIGNLKIWSGGWSRETKRRQLCGPKLVGKCARDLKGP